MSARPDYTRTDDGATFTVHDGGSECRTKGVSDDRRWAIEQLRDTYSDERGRWALNFQTAAVRCFDAATGIYLRQLLFWADKGHDPDGWVYKSKDEFTGETGLTRRNQDTARKKLKGASVLATKKKGVPCTLHYRLNLEVLSETLNPSSSVAQPATLDSADAPNRSERSETSSVAQPAELLHRVPQESTPQTTSENPPLQGGVGPLSAATPPRDIYEIKEEVNRQGFIQACNQHPEWWQSGTSAAALAARSMDDLEAPTQLRSNYEALAEEYLEFANGA